MAMNPPSRSTRRRRLLWLGLLLALPLVAFGLLRWALQPERLGAALLVRAATATGLELAVAEPARLGIWPGLQLELVGLDARLPGAGERLLRADRVDLALPWSALWQQDEAAFGAIRLQAPVLDLDAWTRWRQPAGDEDPPQLPQQAFDIAIRDGRLLGSGWQIDALQLHAGALRDQHPLRLRASGELRRDELRLPWQLRLQATPQQHRDGLALLLQELRLGSGDATLLDLAGRLDLTAPQRLQFDLSGTIAAAWPSAWQPLPEQLAPLLLGQTVAARYTGPADLSDAVELQLASDRQSMQLQLSPAALREWLAAEAPNALPPAAGDFSAERLQFDGLQLDGVTLKLETEAPPDD
jgi:hypothetical protein